MKLAKFFYDDEGGETLYTCPECGWSLDRSDDTGILEHPRWGGGAFFGKGEPIDCSRAGKCYRMMEVELEEI